MSGGVTACDINSDFGVGTWAVLTALNIRKPKNVFERMGYTVNNAIMFRRISCLLAPWRNAEEPPRGYTHQIFDTIAIWL